MSCPKAMHDQNRNVVSLEGKKCEKVAAKRLQKVRL